MDQQNYTFFYTCMFLEWVSSAFEHVMETVSSPELQQRYRSLRLKFDEIDVWLLDELSLREQKRSDAGEANKVFYRFESFQPLFLEWVETMQAEAHGVSQTLDLSEEICLYCFLCVWSLRILEEFERLMLDMASPELRARYQTGYGKRQDLRQWLQGELPFAVAHAHADERQVVELHSMAEKFAEPLADGWRDKVISESRQHLQE